MDLYCSVQDVRGFMGSPHIHASAFPESTITDMIAAAMVKVNAILGVAYGTKVPFSDPIPPVVRYDTARLAAAYLIVNQTSQTEPNKSDFGRLRIAAVLKQLEAIRDCDEMLYAEDGSIIQREAKCPGGKSVPGGSGGCIGVNTIGADAKFSVDMKYSDSDFGELGE